MLIKINIVDFVSISWYSEFFFKEQELFICQEYLLRVKDTSELLRCDCTFSEDIVILEEFSKSDSIFLNLCLDLE